MNKSVSNIGGNDLSFIVHDTETGGGGHRDRLSDASDFTEVTYHSPKKRAFSEGRVRATGIAADVMDIPSGEGSLLNLDQNSNQVAAAGIDQVECGKAGLARLAGGKAYPLSRHATYAGNYAFNGYLHVFQF